MGEIESTAPLGDESTAPLGDESTAPLGDEAKLVTLTRAAAAQLRQLMEDNGITDAQSVYLRVYVAGLGCSGVKYAMNLDNEKDDADDLSEDQGIQIIVDPISQKYVRGVVVSYEENDYLGAFSVTNPLAKGGCGCGKSFQIEDSDASGDSCGVAGGSCGGCTGGTAT